MISIFFPEKPAFSNSMILCSCPSYENQSRNTTKFLFYFNKALTEKQNNDTLPRAESSELKASNLHLFRSYNRVLIRQGSGMCVDMPDEDLNTFTKWSYSVRTSCTESAQVEALWCTVELSYPMHGDTGSSPIWVTHFPALHHLSLPNTLLSPFYRPNIIKAGKAQKVLKNNC